MTSELAPLFEPIAARFDEQSQTIARLRAEVDRLHSTPPQPSAPPPPPPPIASSTGWTLFPPPDTASGARVVYASSSTGKNTNTGLSPDAPVETLAKAISLLRDGAGDRLLLRCGDTFSESFGGWTRSGRSPDQPLLISSYGDGPRPRVVAAATAFSVLAGELHDVALIGLHLTAARRNPAAPDFDPAAPAGHGVRIIRPVTNLLIEDCRLDFFTTNLTLTADDAPGGKVQSVRVRRCQILDAYSTGGPFSGQGLYANHCDGLLIEENVFDHNGWNESVPGAAANIYRHNLYLSAANSAVTARGNVIANGSSHGLQLRAGGVVEDNLFLSNAVHCLLAGATGTFRRNVVLGGRDIDPANPRGLGVVLACADARAEQNLLAQKTATAGNAFTVERNDWTPAGPIRAALLANTVYNWSGNGLEVSADCDLLEFAANDLQRLVPGRKVVTIKGKVARFGFASNRYDTAEPNPGRWFSLAGAFVPFDRWSAATGDTSRIERLEYSEAAATADAPLPEPFLAAARAQSRQTWRDDLTATALCRLLRARFET